MGQRRFGILVDQLTGGDQVPGHRVGGAAIQSRELTPDFGGELLGLDGWWDRRSGRLGRGLLHLRRVLGLGATGPPGPPDRGADEPRSRRGAPARGTTRRAPVCVALPVVGHWCLPVDSNLFSKGYGQHRYRHHSDSDIANALMPCAAMECPRFLGGISLMCVRRCPTFPPGLGSIIGAGWLSFRVRDGSGRFPAAMAAVTLFTFCEVFWWWGVVVCGWCVVASVCCKFSAG